MPEGMRRSRESVAWDQRQWDQRQWDQRQWGQREELRKQAALLVAQLGPGVSRKRVADALHMHHSVANRLYATDGDLLYDVIYDHLGRLTVRVCDAFDAVAPAGPIARLEAVTEAWLAGVAAERLAHHALLTATHLLPVEHRDSVALKYRILLDTMQEALCAAVPGLVDQPAATIGVMQCFHRLLADRAWPFEPSCTENHTLARRIAGMVLTAAQAELSGMWPEFGAAEGLRGNRLVMEAAQARARLSDALDAVASGGEIVITRRGRRLAKLVPAG